MTIGPIEDIPEDYEPPVYNLSPRPKDVKWPVKVAIGFTIFAVGYCAYAMATMVPMLYKSAKTTSHIMANLDENAVKQLPSEFMGIRGAYKIYKDIDGDEDFDSFYVRPNDFDETKVEIQIQKGPNDSIDFIGLDEHALRPDQKPKSYMMDYVNIDDDPKLESILIMGGRGIPMHKVQVELIDGMYKTSDI